jgi:WS/DGAT/MGAT family acyltransferase
MLRHTVTRLPTMPLRVASRLPRLLPYLDVYPSVLGIPGATTFSRLLSHTRNLVTFTRDGQVISRPVLRAPAVSFSGRISSHRVFVFGTQSLADIKKVKNHYGVTVNDVVVSLVSGGVRHWLARHDELLEDPLLAQIPVSVRTEEQRGTFGNRVSVMIVPIPTDVAEPEDRLHRSAQAMSSAKELHGAIPATTLQDVTTFIPPAVHARASRALTSMYQKRLLRPMQNLVISNVPGPPFRLYTAGAELRAYYPVSVIAHGTGLNATVMSYRDDLNIGLIADRYLMPDLRVVLDGMHQELAALLAHC